MTLNNTLYLYINVVSYFNANVNCLLYVKLLITVAQWDNPNTRITNSPLAYSP